MWETAEAQVLPPIAEPLLWGGERSQECAPVREFTRASLGFPYCQTCHSLWHVWAGTSARAFLDLRVLWVPRSPGSSSPRVPPLLQVLASHQPFSPSRT